MDRAERIELILDHYEDPRNYGRVEPASVIQQGGNPGCGDVIELSLRIGPDERIDAIGFQGEGCTISQAGASLLTELVKGRTLSEAADLPHDAVIELLGRELAMTRPRCATLALNVLRAAIKRHRDDRVRAALAEDSRHAERNEESS
jgi:nitrogen fixation protein NifU and related proteins